MEKIVTTILFLAMFFLSSCTNKDKVSNENTNYTEMLQSIQIDSLQDIGAFWRGENVVFIQIRDSLRYYLLKKQSPKGKNILLKHEGHWLLADSLADKDHQLFQGISINRIKYCYEVMDEEKYQIRKISRDLIYGIKIIFTDSIDYFYIPDASIYGVDKYIETNNLKNIFGKWWIRENPCSS
ncbi:MAG: hypothetical protein LBV43_06105 [Prevotella sp.]|jgi:hypothetical protein|nr:hypothetical protein [Prevotella sp.]